MTRITGYEPSLASQLRALWAEAFPEDTEEYIAFFQSNETVRASLRALVSGSELLSAGYFLPYEIFSGGEYRPVTYGYAIATFRSRRGEGCATELMKSQPAPMLLCPNSDLFGFYERRGFTPCLYRRRLMYEGGEGERLNIERATAPEYYALIEKAYRREGFTRYISEMSSFVTEDKRMSGGFCDILTYNGERYALMGAIEDGALALCELTLPAELIEALAPSLCAHYGADRLEALVPDYVTNKGERELYAVAIGIPPQNEGWLSLQLM